MNEPRRTEEEIFTEVLALPREERAHYLADACRSDDAMRQRIDKLLRAHEAAGGFMESSPAEQALPTRASVASGQEFVGTMIGRYKLLQKIGEGGCGIVYMAEQ